MTSRLSLIVLVVCLSLLAGRPVFGKTLFEKFYAEREMLVSIPYVEQGPELSAEMAAQVASSLDDLRAIDPEERLIRVEGFLGREEPTEKNYRSALHRANAIATYLEQNGVPAVAGVSAEVSRGQEREDVAASPWVEIATYPKIRELEGTVKIILDGVK